MIFYIQFDQVGLIYHFSIISFVWSKWFGDCYSFLIGINFLAEDFDPLTHNLKGSVLEYSNCKLNTPLKSETKQQQPNLKSTDNITPSTTNALTEIGDMKSLHFKTFCSNWLKPFCETEVMMTMSKSLLKVNKCRQWIIWRRIVYLTFSCFTSSV